MASAPSSRIYISHLVFSWNVISPTKQAFAPSSELENFVEMFIRSKPSLEAEYNLRELLRRRVYEQEAEGSWGHQEFNGVRVCMCMYVLPVLSFR